MAEYTKEELEAKILEFLAKPIPFCRYCMVDKVKRGLLWETSKKDIKEWTL